MRRLASFVVLVGAASLTASPALAGGVRIFHLSPDTGPVDVRVNGAAPAPLTNLSFGNVAPGPSSTDYAALPTGTYNFDVVAAGTSGPAAISLPNTPIDSSLFVSVAAIGLSAPGAPAGQSIRPLVLLDDNTSNPNAARVRFVHASPNAPAVDVALAGGAVLFGNVLFGEVGDGAPADPATNYLTVAGGAYDLEVRLAGGSNVVLSLPTLNLQNGFVYTVFASGLVGNAATPLEARVYVDAVPAPGAAALLGALGVLAARRRR